MAKKSTASAQPAGRKRQNVAILGFTQHGYQAPWKSDDWDFWGLNDLHQVFEQQVPGIFKTDRVTWFQIHRRDFEDKYPGARDPNHLKWMSEQTCPIYMWEHDDRIPASRAYPIREVLTMAHPTAGFRLCPESYFNNSISWMIALAIYQGYQKIGLFGVDMAMDGVHGESEYAFQRPSVEFWIGVARGLGIEVVMPEVSEVLKCGYLYGYDSATHLRAKCLQRFQDLENAEKGDVDTYETTKKLLYQIKGALMLLTGDGVNSEILAAIRSAVPDEVRNKAIAALQGDEMSVSMDHKAAENAMHECRGAMNNVRWMLRNYMPGDDPVQDVPRQEHALTVTDLAPSDGHRPEGAPVNRLAALEAGTR